MERGGVRCPPLVLGHLDRLAGQPPQNPRRSRPHQVLTWLQESRLKLTFCRLAAVNTLHLSVVSAELLKAVAEHKGLRKLVMIETKLTEVPANLLAHVVVNKREVNLGASDLTDQQVKAIVEAVKPNSPLSTLTLKSVNLSSLEVNSLPRLLTPLQELNICNCQLRPSQVNDMIRNQVQFRFVSKYLTEKLGTHISSRLLLVDHKVTRLVDK